MHHFNFVCNFIVLTKTKHCQGSDFGHGDLQIWRRDAVYCLEAVNCQARCSVFLILKFQLLDWRRQRHLWAYILADVYQTQHSSVRSTSHHIWGLSLDYLRIYKCVQLTALIRPGAILSLTLETALETPAKSKSSITEYIIHTWLTFTRTWKMVDLSLYVPGALLSEL